MPFTVMVGDCDRSRLVVSPHGRLCESEVEHLHNARGRNLDVGRFQIAVNDAVLVRRFERIGDLMPDVQRLADRDRPPGDPLGERVAVDELEDERGRAVHVLEAIDGTDVRMIQRRQQARLAVEAGAPLGIGREEARKDLDRDIAPELRVARAVHLAHAAHAEPREHFVVREAVPDQQRGRGRLGQRGRRDETSREPVGSQQRLHLTQEFAVASGRLLEERGALLGCHRKCRVIDFTDLAIPLRRHDGLVPVNSR